MMQFAGRGRYLAVLGTLLLAQSWGAQVHALSEHDFISDLPVVLSASRLAQPQDESPASVTVIDRELIDASTALDIADLLRLVPGFQVGSVTGAERSITSYGMSDQLGRRIQVLVDGRSVYDPVFGGALWQSLPVTLADVERIEVVRGPNAASFGANAFLGAINIVTRAPGHRPGTRINYLTGSRHTQRLDLARDWQAGGLRLQLSAGLKQDDGFPLRHDDSHSGRVNARLQTNLTPRDRLDILVGLRDSSVDVGTAGDALQPPRSTELGQRYQQVRWQHYLHDGSDISLQLYHSRQDNTDSYDYVPGVLFIDRGFSAERSDAELQWRGALGPATRLVVGAGWRLDQGKAPHAIAADADSSRHQFRLFAHGEQHLSTRWLLQGGLMAEDFEGVGRYVSPRLSLNYRIRPGHALRLSVARGYRLPSLFEQSAFFGLYSSLDGSAVQIPYITPGPLEPERITAYELGLVGDFSGPRLTYDVKLFRHRMENLIYGVENLSTGQWEFRNAGQMDLRGLEIGLDARPAPRTRLHLAFSIADPNGDKWRSYVPGGAVTLQGLDREVPHTSVGLLAEQHFPGGWTASGSWYHIAPMTWSGEGDPISTVDRFDVKLARRFRVHGSRVRLELIGQNLFNQRIDDFHITIPARPGNRFDRQLYARIVIRH